MAMENAERTSGAATHCVSIGRGAARSGPLTSGGAVAVSRRWGLGRLSVPDEYKKRGAVASPSMRNFELESRDS
jgi:hypothetical protein